MKRAALLGALSDRLANDRLLVVAGFGLHDRPSTKAARLALQQIDAGKRTRFLVAVARDERLEWLSLRNLKDTVHSTFVDQLNTYDVLKADYVLFTRTAFEQFNDDAAENNARAAGVKGAVPRGRESELLEKDHEDDTVRPSNLNLISRVEKVSGVTGLTTYVREEHDVEAASIVAEGFDPVVIERHDGFVLVSWPTTLGADAALALLKERMDRAARPEEVTLYAGTQDEDVEHEDGDPVDWGQLARLSPDLLYVRLELNDETLVWSRPDGPHEHDNRFASMATTLQSKSIASLVSATKSAKVLDVLSTVLGAGDWTLDGLRTSA